MQIESNEQKSTNPAANRGHGPQGIDKAPGEETPEDNVQFVQETQKGKKVDGDPELEKDKPAQQDL